MLFLTAIFTAACVNGGGGPENVLLVVNPLDRGSLTIANHYRSLRQIPSANVFHLPWDGSRTAVEIETFRKSILAPILNGISRRRLQQQIDYVVYSSGFPYAIDFSADVRRPLPQESAAAIGSLTSLTFFYSQVWSRNTAYVFTRDNQQSNNYFRRTTQGFRNNRAWGRGGLPTPIGGEKYYLSVMLGYTDGRGNSVDEVLRYLQRSALADGTRPDGTFYFMVVENETRSQTRDGVFPEIKAALNQLGYAAEIESGVMPQGKSDVCGVVLGRSVIQWQQSGSRFLPGAICDNLTSFGGVLKSNASQTPLTDFLKHGAAGASGTVVEPYALQPKFPHPWMQVHYAQGASLGEAFYQSVAAPYQLLIVGDPLCQPWARAPKVFVAGLELGKSVGGKVELSPHSDHPVSIQDYRLFVDGIQIGSCQPGEVFQLDTTRFPDGYHELRIVAIERSPVETQGRLILPLMVDNRGHRLDWTIEPTTIAWNQSAELSLSSPGAETILLFHGRQYLGRIRGAQGRLTVDSRTLGEGPVTLTAIATRSDAEEKVVSTPIRLTVRSEEGY